MSSNATSTTHGATTAIIGEPEVVEDGGTPVEATAAWHTLKASAIALQGLQAKDGSVADPADHSAARIHVDAIVTAIRALAPRFPHDAEYLEASVADFARWDAAGFGVPDFYDSLVAFQPQQQRVDGIRHLVVFPMYTQNGSSNRFVEALIAEVIWPEFVAELETEYSNKLFVSLRLVDFTPGYDTNSAVLFPETVAMREIPTFTWGAIFQDREAARYRRVVRAAAEITKLELPEPAARMLEDQDLAEQTFVMWDLIHDRTHMRGDLPFDPFMIKQRMPYFLYSLEELRCDLTAFRESVAIEERLRSRTDGLSPAEAEMLEHAGLAQYAVIFDRIFRFAITGTAGAQLRRARRPAAVRVAASARRAALDRHLAGLRLGGCARPRSSHSAMRSTSCTGVRSTARRRRTGSRRMNSCAVCWPRNPASLWARGLSDEVLAGPVSGYTNAVLDDEFPLSMFYEALEKKMRSVIASTAGIRGTDV